MRIGGYFRLFWLLLMGPALLLGAASAQAAEQTKVMIVLDASGSMWGQIKGAPKIVIARQAIRDLLSDWDKDVQLGLSAYGHRKKGDCKDIQTIYPVGPTRPDAILKAVNGLKPKGKTPLSEAVRRAAQELKFTEDKAAVILVSDGRETCRADPCALGSELAKLGVDFKVHVVGFDVAKDEQEDLRCLAENTGGLFLTAENASELDDALSKAVTAVKEEPKKVAAKPAPRPAPPPQKVVEPGHHFAAALSEGDDPVTRDMRWDIYAATPSADGKRQHVNGTYNAQPKFTLNAGQYRAVAKYGDATVSQDFTVASAGEAKSHVLVLNAGLLALKATFADENGDGIAQGMRWDVFHPEQDAEGKRKHINGTYDSTPVFKLPQGRFFVVAKTGNAVASGEVEIKAGERTEQVFVMNAGIAAFAASYSEGGTAVTKGMRWDVYGAEKDLDGKRKHINGTYDTKPVFRLPAGRYFVVAKRGDAVVTKEIEVEAGRRIDTAFAMNAGLLAPSAVLTAGEEPLSKGLRWDVFAGEKDIEGKRKHINGTYDARPTFTLSAGTYYVVVKTGQAVRTAEVEIDAGKRAEPQFDLDAGMVKLVAVTADGSQVKSGLRWDIYAAEKDIEGKRKHFGGTYDATPIFTLGAGDYVIAMKRGQAVKEHPLTVKPGDSRQVDVTLD